MMVFCYHKTTIIHMMVFCYHKTTIIHMMVFCYHTNVPSKLCACAHSRETSARKKTRSAQKISLQKRFLHICYARHPIYRRVLVNVAQTEFYAHTYFRKLEGTLIITQPLFT